MKALHSVLVLFVLVTFLLPCGAVVASAETKRDFAVEGVTVAASKYWEPYSFVTDHGDASGYLVDVWRLWSKKTGIPVHFQFTSWKDSVESVKQGEVQVHSGLLRCPEREDHFAFSEPIHTTYTVLMVKKGSGVSCDGAYSSDRFGVVANTSSESFLRAEHLEKGASYYTVIRDVLHALIVGDIDAMLADYHSVIMEDEYIDKSASLQLCGKVSSGSIRAGVAKDDTELLNLVNDGLNRISQKELATIEKRWFVQEEEPFQLKGILIPAGVIILLVGFFVVLWATKR